MCEILKRHLINQYITFWRNVLSSIKNRFIDKKIDLLRVKFPTISKTNGFKISRKLICFSLLNYYLKDLSYPANFDYSEFDEKLKEKERLKKLMRLVFIVYECNVGRIWESESVWIVKGICRKTKKYF